MKKIFEIVFENDFDADKLAFSICVVLAVISLCISVFMLFILKTNQ